MNSNFAHFLNRCITVYLDDMTVFSRRQKKHLKDLRKVLKKCREHKISLNATKIVFSIIEGKFLGHMVSKEGIKIDPERVKAIKKLFLPINCNGVKSFFGKINFLRKFVPNFVEIIKPMVKLLSEKQNFKWDDPTSRAFKEVKEATAKALTLFHPNFKKTL